MTPGFKRNVRKIKLHYRFPAESIGFFQKFSFEFNVIINIILFGNQKKKAEVAMEREARSL